MKRRYTDEQIIGILKEHEAGVSAKDLYRKYGMSDASFYKWKAKYSGMEVKGGQSIKRDVVGAIGLADLRGNPAQTQAHQSIGTAKTGGDVSNA